MNAFRHLCRLTALVAILVSGCSSPHGQPNKGSEVLAPNEVLDFGTLYAENCAGCHGAEGRGGAAIALANPVYLAIADDAAIRKVIAHGVQGTAMPAFAESAGGMLTDAQIDVISEAKPHIKPIASLATVLAVEADARAAPLRMIRFLRWSATKDCARLSSPAVLN